MRIATRRVSGALAAAENRNLRQVARAGAGLQQPKCYPSDMLQSCWQRHDLSEGCAQGCWRSHCC